MKMRKEMSKWLASNFAGRVAAIAAELMINFWFGTGVIFIVGVVDNLNY